MEKNMLISHKIRYYKKKPNYCGKQWPRGLRCGSVAADLLTFWVWIPPVTWMSVLCQCCVLSGRDICFGLITRLDEVFKWVYLNVIAMPRKGRTKPEDPLKRVTKKKKERKKNLFSATQVYVQKRTIICYQRHKAYGGGGRGWGAGVQLHLFLEHYMEVNAKAQAPVALLQGREHCTHWIEEISVPFKVWGFGGQKITCPCQDWKPGPSIHQLSHFTDYDAPAQIYEHLKIWSCSGVWV